MRTESTEAKDWSHLLAKHRGEWVALAERRCNRHCSSADGEGCEGALAASASKGNAAPILYRVPDTLDTLVRQEVSAHPHHQANDQFRDILPFC